jgi:hypothetical protein
MLTGSLPATTNFGTWVETVEFLDTEDNEPIDFSICEDIVLVLYDQWSGSAALTLSKGAGTITTPAPGIIQWRAEAGNMGGFNTGTYQVQLTAFEDDDAVPLMMSSVTIVGL